MKNQNDAIVKTLNNLIETNIDRSKGYETAVEEMKDMEYASRFNEYASQSRTFRNELDALVREFGGEPQKASSASGTVYRAWMETKAALTGKDTKAILGSCEFGEDAAKKSYADAVKDAIDYPTRVQDVINRQQRDILQAHDTIRNLRDSEVHHH